jgi:hypothetical protein
LALIRVHELAKDCGVTSRDVLEQLKQMGEFIKSASSPVPLAVEMRFRREYRGRLENAPPSAEVVQPQVGRRPRAVEEELLKPHRPTSWASSAFDAAGQHVWRMVGLGEDDAPLALYLVQHGIWPEDLRLDLRGRRAVSRLRGGEESWHLLVKEIRDVRARATRQEQALPETRRVTRRRLGGR